MTSPFRCNGIDATTGRYALPEVSVADLCRLARARRMVVPELAALLQEREIERRVDRLRDLVGRLPGRAGAGLHEEEGRDWDPAVRGWGVVFAEGDPREDEIREALSPLLDLRREQASRLRRRRYRELRFQPGESLWEFRRRHRAEAGVSDPSTIPYYLLLVGGPDRIPFEVQAQLSVSHAVGRLDFPRSSGFARYAASVVAAEGGKSSAGRRAVFFAPEHPAEPLSKESARRLAGPLATWVRQARPDCAVDTVLGGSATKERLSQLLARAGAAPALLFTAGHGAVFPLGARLQERHQGALICSDWRGPRAAAISADDYFAAEDLPHTARLGGLIAFHFACCSVGVPERNDLHRTGLKVPERLAPRPFVSNLPRRMLSLARGGALAVIGQVGLVFAGSFRGASGRPRLYQECLERLFSGLPVGVAMEPFRRRSAQLSVELNDLLLGEGAGRPVLEEVLADLSSLLNDAENSAILGDPLVRMPAFAA